ncbi:MAG: hypothetical protein ACOYKG_05295 [Ilumatobacteraceae bacterium]
MKINKSFIRIALAVGLVGLAACSGSDSSSSRQKNSALATNVLHYVGTAQASWASNNALNAAFRTDDRYKVSFDLNLDTADANASSPAVTTGCWDNSVTPIVFTTTGCEYAWKAQTSEVDFRSAISNFSVSNSTNNLGTEDLSKIQWAKCPSSFSFEPVNTNDQTPPTNIRQITLAFVEAPNPSFVTAECNPIPSGPTIDFGPGMFGPGMPGMGGKKFLYDANGVAVEATGATFSLRFSVSGSKVTLPTNISQPVLKDVLSTGLDGLQENNVFIDGSISSSTKIQNTWIDNNGKTQKNPQNASISLKSLSSSPVKDYAPYDLTATANESGISANWKLSADLAPSDQPIHILEWSTDGFENSVYDLSTGGLTADVPSCQINQQNDLGIGDEISLRVYALDGEDNASNYSDVVTVTKTAENLVCPESILAAPTNVVADFSLKDMSVTISWEKPADAGDSVISYCVESSSDSFKGDASDARCGIDTTSTVLELTEARSFRVLAIRDTGAVSPVSDVVDVMFPETEPVTNLKAVLSGEDVKVSWVNNQATGVYNKAAYLSWGIMGATERGPEVGNFVAGTSFYTIPVINLGPDFVPGSTVWIDVQAWSLLGSSKSTSTTFEYLAAGSSTPTPVVDDTAKAAIVDATATEVQLPAADVEVAVDLTELLKGFSVAASDVSTVEYQVADGSWVALSKGDALKIPKSAAKLSVRVTKKNGEKVVSEKALVHAEASTDTTMAPADTTAASADTTMAPADTTAPVTTEAPASSDSSSSNNTVLYILGFVIVAGAVVMILKKKSASAPK